MSALKDSTKRSATLTEHDLAYPIDYREEEESKKVKLQLHATNVVTEGLKLKQEKLCADLVQNPDNYPTGNKIILSGTSKFSDEENSDPIGVIEDAKDAIAGKIAQDPNTMVIGHDTWKKLKRHKKFRELISGTQNKIVTLNFLKETFEIPNIVIGRSVFVDEQGNFVKIWGDNVILAYVPQLTTRTEYDPSFAYLVRKQERA